MWENVMAEPYNRPLLWSPKININGTSKGFLLIDCLSSEPPLSWCNGAAVASAESYVTEGNTTQSETEIEAHKHTQQHGEREISKEREREINLVRGELPEHTKSPAKQGMH